MKVNIFPEQIITFKLNSGEELVAKVKEVTEDMLSIENPVSIAPGPQGMALVPSLFTADIEQEIKLNTNSIAIYGLTDESVTTKYIEATTGIKLPEKKLILG